MEDSIKILSKRQLSLRKNAFQPQTIFIVLGLLSEYAGRMVLKDGDLVESFYVNEKYIADVFEKYLNLLIQEYSLKTEIKKVEENGFTMFYSKEMKDLIDSYYLDNFLTGIGKDKEPLYTIPQGIFSQNAGKINNLIFSLFNVDEMFSYLVGAYYRFGKGNTFLIANAFHKAMLIIELLIHTESKRVTFISPPPESVPFVSNIKFSPNYKMKKYFLEIPKSIFDADSNTFSKKSDE